MFFPYRDDNPTHGTPLVTYAIVAINVVVLLGLGRLSPGERQQAVLEHGFIPARLTELPAGRGVGIQVEQLARHPTAPVAVRVPARLELPPAPRAIAASLVTSIFMHAGWLHLLGNMWFLWIFGNNVEDHLGHGTYLVFYLFGGLLATGCHWLNDPHSTIPVVGASGAVAAVLGAYAIRFPHARVHTLVFLFIFITVIDLPAFVVLGAWFVGQVLEATQASRTGVAGGVAWWAHIGGFVAGMALMPLLDRGPPPRRRAPPADADADVYS